MKQNEIGNIALLVYTLKDTRELFAMMEMSHNFF